MIKSAELLKSAKIGARNLLVDLTDILGLLQSKIGIEPTFIRSPRTALEQWKLRIDKKSVPVKGRIAIVAFRNFTWVEWAVFAAHYIFTMGYQPVIIYSGSEIKNIYSKKRVLEKLGFGFWDDVLKLKYIERVDLDDHLNRQDGLKDPYLKFAEEFSPTIAAYNLRVEELEEDIEVEKYEEERKNSSDMLAKYGAAIERCLKALKFDRLICPSGLIGMSAVFLEVTKRLNIKSVFIEGWTMRPGHMIWAVNRPALIFDIKGWMDVIGGWDGIKERDASDFLKFQEREAVTREDWLEDFHPAQRSAKSEGFSESLQAFLSGKGPLFLLGANVIGDSSILRRATIFKNQKQWLRYVIDFFIKNNNFRLIIRAHPDEGWQRAKIKIGEFARQLAKGASNIFIINATEDVNTYSLVEHADAGLVWVSNIGLDMVIRGKPVLMAASPKYDDLGIVYRPKTKEEYFQKIIEYAENKPCPSQDMIRTAKLYQRIIFKEMSLEAIGKHYTAVEYRLGENRMHKDQEKFYKILVGELNERGYS